MIVAFGRHRALRKHVGAINGRNDFRVVPIYVWDSAPRTDFLGQAGDMGDDPLQPAQVGWLMRNLGRGFHIYSTLDVGVDGCKSVSRC